MQIKTKLTLLWIALNALDAITTIIGLQHFKGHELNPAMAFLLRRGVGYFICGKMGIALALAAYFVKFDRLKAIRIALILVSLVVGWNCLGLATGFWLSR